MDETWTTIGTTYDYGSPLATALLGLFLCVRRPVCMEQSFPTEREPEYCLNAPLGPHTIIDAGDLLSIKILSGKE